MIGALYSGLSGLLNFQKAIDVTGNNSANIDTIAYKHSRVTFKTAVEYMLTGSTNAKIGTGTMLNTIDRNMVQGPIENTGRYSDLAIAGSGFFAAGDFRRNANGELVKMNSYLTRVGKFEVLSNLNLVQGDVGLHILGIPSTIVNGEITKGEIPDQEAMIRMTPQEKAAFYDSLKLIDLVKYQTMGGKATGAFEVFGTMASEVGPQPHVFELTSATDSRVSYKVRLSFDRDVSDLSTVFQDDKTYHYKLEVTDWSQGGYDRPPIVGSSGTITFDKAGNIASINGGNGQLLTFEINGETFKLSRTELLAASDYKDPSVQVIDTFYNSSGEIVKDGVVFEKLSKGTWLFRPARYDAKVASVSFIGESGAEYSFEDEELNLLGGVLRFDENGRYESLSLMKADGALISDTPTHMKWSLLDGTTQSMAINLHNILSGGGVQNDLQLLQEGGRATGSLRGLEFDKSGYLIGTYSNQKTATLAVLPLVQMRVPETLTISSLYSTAYNFDPIIQANNFTGVFEAGNGGTGLIEPYALEYSNVETAKEMTRLIIYQRALQLNARSVTTADAILQQAYELKR